MRILLVDDEFELVSTLAERLSMRGFAADWATDGEGALAKIAAAPYEVVVIDIKMPKMSGIEVKRRMEKLRPGMHYIFMTGHGSEGDFQTGSSELGSERYYLLKPVSIEALQKKIREVTAA